MVDNWAGMLSDISFENAKKAVLKHARVSVFAPTIADIIAYAKEFERGGDDGLEAAEEAWGKVQAAIANSAYDYMSEYGKLPPICQRLVGSPQQLRDWSQCEIGSATIEFARERFLKQYDIYLRRERENQKLPPQMRELLGYSDEPIKELVERNTVDPTEPIPTEKPKEDEVDPDAQRRAQRVFDLVRRMKEGTVKPIEPDHA
jgi:hypothetical protein